MARRGGELMGRASGRDFRRIALMGVALVGCVALADCSASRVMSDKYSQRVVADGEQVPKGGGVYKVGQPYTINGQTYTPTEGAYRAEGVASWYGPDFHGRQTANGEVFDMHGISAAHPTLPIPSYARVTDLDNGRSIIVRVNDRGPYARNRIIDVSIGAAQALGFYDNGLANVRVEYIGRAPLEGSDDRMLLASLRQGKPAQVTPQMMVASAEPFVPNFNAEETPLPPERPFALGGSPAHQAAKSSNVSVAANSATTAGPGGSAAKSPPAKNQKLSDLSQDSRGDTGRAGAASGQNDAFVLGLMSARGLY